MPFVNEYKLIVLGGPGVGKSACTVQYVQGHFVAAYDPTIEDSYRKNVEIDGDLFSLNILDTAGTEQFSAMRQLYMKDGKGFVVMFSLISRAAFQEAEEIRETISRVKDRTDFPMVLVGNKCDLQDLRVITTDEGERKAKEWNCSYLECSAKTKYNIDKIFSDLVLRIKAADPNFKKKSNSKTKKCTIL